MHKSWYLVVAAFTVVLLAASPVAAQTATLYLNSPGSGENLAGVYTSPYYGTINGGSTVPVICDDFADESFVPEEWTANVTNLSSLSSSTVDANLKWGTSATGTSNDVNGSDPVSGTWNLTQAAAYDVAALLAIDILENSGPANAQTQEDLSFAMWGLFDSSAAFGALAGLPDQANAENDLSAAFSQYNTLTSNGDLSSYISSFGTVTIYSYVSPSNGGMTPLCGSPLVGCAANGYQLPPQEFITVTAPEASTPVLLAIDLLGLMALVGFFRKRMTRSV
jgi:hypothetical protein